MLGQFSIYMYLICSCFMPAGNFTVSGVVQQKGGDRRVIEHIRLIQAKSQRKKSKKSTVTEVSLAYVLWWSCSACISLALKEV